MTLQEKAEKGEKLQKQIEDLQHQIDKCREDYRHIENLDATEIQIKGFDPEIIRGYIQNGIHVRISGLKKRKGLKNDQFVEMFSRGAKP